MNITQLKRVYNFILMVFFGYIDLEIENTHFVDFILFRLYNILDVAMI